MGWVPEFTPRLKSRFGVSEAGASAQGCTASTGHGPRHAPNGLACQVSAATVLGKLGGSIRRSTPRDRSANMSLIEAHVVSGQHLRVCDAG